MIRIVSLSIPLVLAACVQQGPELPPIGVADQCNAGTFRPYIGRNLSALDGIEFPPGTRIIGPRQAVTQDLQPQRLNITYDRQRTIIRVHCG